MTTLLALVIVSQIGIVAWVKYTLKQQVRAESKRRVQERLVHYTERG